MYLARVCAIKLLKRCAILMNDPIGSLPLGSSSSIEDKGLLHSNQTHFPWLNCPVFTSGLPVTSFSGTVGPMPIGILTVSRAKEEPLMVIGFNSWQAWTRQDEKQMSTKRFCKKTLYNMEKYRARMTPCLFYWWSTRAKTNKSFTTVQILTKFITQLLIVGEHSANSTKSTKQKQIESPNCPLHRLIMKWTITNQNLTN